MQTGYRATFDANLAMPLNILAYTAAIPATLKWSRSRVQTPLPAIPDRLLPVSVDVFTQSSTAN
ncbi:GNAT family N-acetyltransferase, cg3035/Rv0428c family [Mycobacterium leprae]|uniref:GNAT family N-acetyltransferase, cg3035/Rv0428c family n=1 Tax=Mycobacterium leprae TaxID=1769 RepID=UPI003B8A9761